MVLFVADRAQSLKRQGFFVGTTLFLLILLIGASTGASFNPARSLGPALASGYLANQPVFWIGPVSGGLIAALIFSRAAGHARPSAKEDSLCMC